MKFPQLLIIGIAIFSSAAAFADFYKVNVKRIDQDLYRTDSGFYIQTQYCYVYSYGEDAVLKYQQHSFDNKIIFNSGTTCDVKKVFK